MAEARSGSLAGGSDRQLFRDSMSPQVSEQKGEDVMQVDGDQDTAMTTAAPPGRAASTTLASTLNDKPQLEGDEGNLRPIVDGGVEAHSASEKPSSHPSAVKGAEAEETTPNGDANLLASLPVYFSTSLPSSSSLQIFQYPTYSRGAPLPVPSSAQSRGLREAIRYRPKAKRVEVELPLDLRPAVYNLDRGEDMAKGANVGGTIGQGPSGKAKKEVKKEFGADEGSSSSQRGAPKRLEKTRLESGLIPHQTQYMVGVIRDKALHLTPVDSIIQLRPSMHYLDALDAMAQQEKRRAQAEPADETDEGSLTEDGGRTSAKAKEKKKAQSLNVSVRADAGGTAAAGPRSKGAVTDGRDQLMLADREAEGERWIDLDWKNEKSEESKKTFDAQLFASSKTPLECLTRPREFLHLT